MIKNTKEKISFEFETTDKTFKKRLKKVNKINNIINSKNKKKPIPIFSTNQEELIFDKKGTFNLNTLKKSVVVNFNEQLITTKKRVVVVSKTSLKKAKSNLKEKSLILETGTNIESKINKFVVKNKEKLSSLNEELSKLSKGLSNVYKKEEVDDKKKKILNIKKQAEILKIECLLISGNSDFENFDFLHDEALLKNIELFTLKASNQEIKDLAISCKTDLDYVDNLLEVLSKSDYLDYEINKKDKTIKKRDEDFKEYKKDVSDLYKIKNTITSEIKEEVAKSYEIIERLKKFDESKDVLSINQLRSIANDYIDYILNGDYLIKLFHFLTFNIFKNDKKETLKQIQNKEQLIKIIYSDYSQELNKEIADLKQLSTNIKVSIEQLSWLKTVFKNKFYKYQDLFSEYKEIYIKLEKLEEKLIHDHEIVKNVEDELKVKKLEIKYN